MTRRHFGTAYNGADGRSRPPKVIPEGDSSVARRWPISPTRRAGQEKRERLSTHFGKNQTPEVAVFVPARPAVTRLDCCMLRARSLPALCALLLAACGQNTDPKDG